MGDAVKDKQPKPFVEAVIGRWKLLTGVPSSPGKRQFEIEDFSNLKDFEKNFAQKQ